MKRTLLFTCTGIILAALVAVRSIILLTMVDAQSGFYFRGQETMPTIFSIVLAVAAAVTIIVLKLIPHRTAGVVPSSPPLSLASFFVGFALFFDIAMQLFADFDVLGWPDINLMSLGAAAGAAMVVNGVRLWTGIRAFTGVLPLFPVLWSLARLIILFIRFNGITKISENAYDIVAAALIMMFWLFHAKWSVRAQIQQTTGWIYGLGITAAGAGLLVSIPRYAVLILGEPELFTYSSDPLLVNLSMPIYILIFLVLISSDQANAAAQKIQQEQSQACAASLSGFVQMNSLQDDTAESADTFLSQTNSAATPGPEFIPEPELEFPSEQESVPQPTPYSESE